MKIIKLFSHSIMFLSLLSFYPVDQNYLILDENDFDYARENNLSPALTIPDMGFESYNQWQCFNSKEIELVSSEVDYHGIHSVPTIQYKNMSFDLDPDILWNTEDVFLEWEGLLQEAKSICIFGAFLQEGPEYGSLWYIEKIKTENGYWSRSESAAGASRLRGE